jgi:hypothetical protein
MPTYATNVLPANTGLNLGASNQQWSAFLLNAFGTTFQSNTANPALTGVLRLASADGIAWRNNANSADVTLSKTGAAAGNVPADTLTFSGGGIEGPFISQSSSPAASGILRLASSDAVNFRNNGNTGDINGLSHNSDDSVTVGGSAGAKTTSLAASSAVTAPSVTATTVISNDFNSASANTALAGIVRLANTDMIAWRNAANSADVSITLNSSNQLSVPALAVSGLLASYNGILTRGVGQPSIPASVTIQGPNAITTTTLYTTIGASFWRLNYYLYAAVVGNAVNATATFGWFDTAAHTLTTGTVAMNTLGANTSTALGLGSFTFFSAGSQLITYATALSGGIGAGQYGLSISLEQIG